MVEGRKSSSGEPCPALGFEGGSEGKDEGGERESRHHTGFAGCPQSSARGTLDLNSWKEDKKALGSILPECSICVHMKDIYESRESGAY